MDLILTPDYGRDYKSQDEVLDDWDNHKDFRIATPEYAGFTRLNKADYFKYKDELMPDVTAVKFRYNNLTKAFYLPTN